MQRHARHVGLDLRDFDAVIGFARALRDAGYVGAAALARWRRHRAGSWVGMKRTMCPDMRLGLPLAGWLRRLLPLRRRNAGIVGRLRRQAQLRLKFGDPRDERLDPPTSAAIKASFSGKSGGGVTRRLTHIPMSPQPKKYSPNTAIFTPQTGVSNCIREVCICHDRLCPNNHCAMVYDY